MGVKEHDFYVAESWDTQLVVLQIGSFDFENI